MNVRIFALPLVMLGLTAWDATAARATEPDGTSELAALVEAHNRERAGAGLPPLSANSKLEEAATAHARDMAEHGKMSHEGSDGSNPSQRVERAGYHYQGTGENVAMGYPDIPAAMKGWMNSPKHKANILGNFIEMGAARVVSADGMPYWCVNFGLPYPKVDPSKAAAAIVEALNRAREKAGLTPLKVNPKLEAVAQHHAHDFAARGEYREEDNDGMTPVQRLGKTGYAFLSFGELAASGQPGPEDVVKTWLDNPANHQFLVGDFRDVGVGCAASEKGIPYWCLLLTKPAP